MSQGGPLDIIDYGINIPPLIKNLKTEFPDITHPFYADNDGALCKFTRVKSYFHLFKKHGPGRRYYPQPSKRVLIVHPEHIKDRKWFGLRHGLKVCTGACYLGFYIRDDESKHYLMKERMETWERSVFEIR